MAEDNKVKRNPRDKFRDLAVARVNRALQDLRLVGNLANKKSYEWDEAQAKKIIRALEQGVEQVKQRYSQSTGKDAGDFTL
jgi:ABC-type Fe3+-hydroxamate transport system substrate-binding protein